MEKKMEMENKNLEVFSNAPVPQAVLKNVLPAMAAMIMVLIYNLADTFFIGQTRNAILIAAVSLAMPVFLIFMAVGTVFGVDGTSVISRALGEGRKDYAKKVCSFCMWGCVIVGVVMTALFLVFMDQILTLVGASPDTMGPAKTYLTIVSLGGIFVIISNCYSNIIRAEGQAGKAMMGQLIGNLLNVVLDPIMILVFGWGIAGAAVATVIGNLFGAAYYVLYFHRGNSVLSIHPKDFAVKDRICSGVLAIGIPVSLGSLLMSVSQIVVNSQLVNYGDMAVAGMGQGVQPLLGYCVGAGVWDRFKKVFRFSVLFALAIGVIMTLLCYLFTSPMVKVFLENPEAYDYGVRFARILLSTSALFGVFYVLCNTLQAMGAATAVLYVYTIRRMESKTKGLLRQGDTGGSSEAERIGWGIY